MTYRYDLRADIARIFSDAQRRRRATPDDREAPPLASVAEHESKKRKERGE